MRCLPLATATAVAQRLFSALSPSTAPVWDPQAVRTRGATTAPARGMLCPHVCLSTSASTIRRIHSNISAAFGFAIKWGWADRNPADHASPPRLNRPDIEPPDPAQVARLLDVAWKRDPDFGTFLWMAVVTGARRGELVAVRWTDIRWQEADLLIARGYVSHRGQQVIKDTKTLGARKAEGY